jgi:agmatinase
LSLRLKDLTAGSVALIGVPLDENSSYLRGPAQAPSRIREALYSGASSDCSEDGTVVLGSGRFFDAGDVGAGSGSAALQTIEAGVLSVLERGARPLSLGGDHSVTFPIVRALAAAHPDLAILQFDAHPDLYDTFDGNRFSHASPFARIMEAGLARRLVQVGIRSINRHLREQAERFEVEMVMMRDLTPDLGFTFEQPVYVSIDLDALDPSVAPGVGHHEPGGLGMRDLLRILERSRGRVVGADVVELNPLRDLAGTTAAVAAKLVRELAARMLRDAPAGRA